MPWKNSWFQLAALVVVISGGLLAYDFGASLYSASIADQLAPSAKPAPAIILFILKQYRSIFSSATPIPASPAPPATPASTPSNNPAPTQPTGTPSKQFSGAVAIDVAADGTVELEHATMTLSALQQKLAVFAQDFPNQSVILGGAKDVKYKDVIAVLDACRAAKLTNLPSPSDSAPATVLLALGWAQFHTQNFNEAKKLGGQALSQETGGPNNANARMLLGEVAGASQDYVEAARIFTTLAILLDDPKITPQAMSRAAHFFEKAGDVKSANDWRQKLKDKFPGFQPISSPDYLPVNPAPIQSASTPPATTPPSVPAPVTSSAPVAGGPVANQPWTNSLGMKYVPAGTDGVLFSIYDTRVKDFRAYVEATGHKSAGMNTYELSTDANGKPAIVEQVDPNGGWQNPGFMQEPDHPVVCVSWNDANAFCEWLTKKEQAEGKIGANVRYRLPTDAEWSKAVGLNEGPGTPEEKMTADYNATKNTILLWGSQWPPPPGVGNFAGGEVKSTYPRLGSIAGYDDGYVNTSPVGSFSPSTYGLYDMEGNVYQWCEDAYSQSQRVLRGSCWNSGGNFGAQELALRMRGRDFPTTRNSANGFRVVIVTSL